MGFSSLLWLHLVSPVAETMTHFLCGLKRFHGALPACPQQWLPQARTGKVSRYREARLEILVSLRYWQFGPNGGHSGLRVTVAALVGRSIARWLCYEPKWPRFSCMR